MLSPVQNKGETVTRRQQIRSPLQDMNYYVLIFVIISSSGTNDQALSSESTANASKNSTESREQCLISRFPLRSLLCAGHREKVVQKPIYTIKRGFVSVSHFIPHIAGQADRTQCQSTLFSTQIRDIAYLVPEINTARCLTGIDN